MVARGYRAPDVPKATAHRSDGSRVQVKILREQSLSSRSQVVLKPHCLEGFGLGEIAHILGTPEGTVKSRLHGAGAEFKKHWEALSGNPPATLPASGPDNSGRVVRR